MSYSITSFTWSSCFVVLVFLGFGGFTTASAFPMNNFIMVENRVGNKGGFFLLGGNSGGMGGKKNKICPYAILMIIIETLCKKTPNSMFNTLIPFEY